MNIDTGLIKSEVIRCVYVHFPFNLTEYKLIRRMCSMQKLSERNSYNGDCRTKH